MRVICAIMVVGVLCVAVAATFAQTRTAAPVAVLPNGALGKAYYYQLATPQQGTPPWRFGIVRGSLPPGLALSSTGLLSGTPTASGEFRFTLEATDSSPAAVAKRRSYALTVPPSLTVAWIQPPQVAAGGIAGELQVTNGAASVLDLTVIVVAVNPVGKAFALGYQRFSLATGLQRITFSALLPSDTYVVHADAVGEDPAGGRIYRARLQTDSLTVP